MVDVEGKSPLDYALDGHNDNYDEVSVYIALYLVNHGCGDDKDKDRLLFAACCQGELNVVKELITKHKVEPNGERIVALCLCMFL